MVLSKSSAAISSNLALIKVLHMGRCAFQHAKPSGDSTTKKKMTMRSMKTKAKCSHLIIGPQASRILLQPSMLYSHIVYLEIAVSIIHNQSDNKSKTY